MCILWYHRNIKVNPTFLGLVKLSGGVNLTPYVLVGWTLNMPTGADGNLSRLFPSSVKTRWRVINLIFNEWWQIKNPFRVVGLLLYN